MELKITRIETEEDVVIKQQNVHLPGRAMHRNCLMSVIGCSFSAPGTYAVNLRFKDENDDMASDLAHRLLKCFKIRSYHETKTQKIKTLYKVKAPCQFPLQES